MLFNFADGEFTPGTEYTFVAYASNAVGEGPPSKPATFTPRVPGPPTIDAVALVSWSLSLDVSPPTDPGSSRMSGAAARLVMDACLLGFLYSKHPHTDFFYSCICALALIGMLCLHEPHCAVQPSPATALSAVLCSVAVTEKLQYLGLVLLSHPGRWEGMPRIYTVQALHTPSCTKYNSFLSHLCQPSDVAGTHTAL